MSTAHADAMREGDKVLFVKGAPDVLLARCTSERVGDAERPARRRAPRARSHGRSTALPGEALRTLGIAYRRLVADEFSRLEPATRKDWCGSASSA